MRPQKALILILLALASCAPKPPQEEKTTKLYTDRPPAEEQALQRYAVVDHPEFGKIYAYEDDGFGSHQLMDDANVPSLLALGYLDPERYDDPVYLNTRKFVWNENKMEPPVIIDGKLKLFNNLPQ